MPLELLLILVVCGIAGITLLLHLTGHSAGMRFDEASARSQWARHEPSAPALDVHLSSDRRAALIATASGPALLWAMGADSTGHWAHEATVQSTSDGLLIRLGDFAAPRVRVMLSPEDRKKWTAEIGQTASEAKP